MIKTVLWDVDATLLNFEASEEISIQKLFAKYGVEMDEERLAIYQKINRGYWLGLEEGRYDRHTVLTKRFDDFFDVLGLPHQDTDAMNDFYQLALGTYVVKNKGAKETLEAIGALGLPQYVVSNGSTIAQENKLENSHFDRYMKDVFISEKIGYEKPDPRFFKAVAESIHYDPKKTVIIGDSLTSDMTGGVNAGLKTIWYNPKHLENALHLPIDHTIEDLTEVIEIVKNEK